MIEIKNLCKIYKTNKEEVVALNDINLKIQEKGMIFIVGKSGSGKSTLLNVLGGLDKITSGEILINDNQLTKFTQSQMDSYRNLHIGFVFQDYNLLNEFTIKENISLAMELQGEKVTDEKLKDVLSQVDLKEEYLLRKPSQLSGGERQRIAIARALIKKPEIILADEPTGALNSELSAGTFELLKKLSKEKLVLIVSHDMESALKYGDRIIELADGKIISDKEYVEKNQEQCIKITADEIIYPEDYELTKEDLNKIDEILKENQGKKDIKITKIQNRELKETNLENIKMVKSDLTLKKAKLPLMSAVKIGMQNFFAKKYKLLITILLSVFAFTCLGVAHTLGTINLTKVETKALYNDSYEYFCMIKENEDSKGETFNQYDIEHAKKYLNAYVKEIYGSVSLYCNKEVLEGYNKYNTDYKYLSNITTLTEYDLDYFDFDLYGRLPDDNTNEIVVTDYIYQAFKLNGYVENRDINTNSIAINNKDDLIGKTITIKDNSKLYHQYVIVGIVDTHFDLTKYKKLEDCVTNPPNLFKDTEISKLLDDYNYNSNLFHSCIFLPENHSTDYFENMKNKIYRIIGEMPTSKSKINDLVKYSNTYYKIQGHNNKLKCSMTIIPLIGEIERNSNFLEDNFLKYFLIIGVLLAVFSYVLLSNFISQSIEAKQKEIGIFRALGARKIDIFKLFVCESGMMGLIILILSFIGTIIGDIFMNNYVKSLSFITFDLIFANMMQVLLLTLLIAICVLMATYFSIKKYVAETPIEAIKKKK